MEKSGTDGICEVEVKRLIVVFVSVCWLMGWGVAYGTDVQRN